MNILILIPAYNEAKTIGSLVREIKAVTEPMEVCFDLLVVDDGSCDSTCSLAEEAGARVLRHKKNKGKGVSVREGFAYAGERNYESVIIMDGDGQHEPKDIVKFVKAASRSGAGIITGNRMHRTRNMPVIRILTNKCMSLIISWIVHQAIPDTQCGFRLLKKEVLDNIRCTSSYFEIESEILIRAGRQSYKVESIPIKTIYRRETSAIKPITDTIRFARLIFRTICRKA